jgi:hypothetical protein
MTAKELVLPRVVATSTGSIATVTTLNLTADINLLTLLGTTYRSLDRIVVIFRGTTAGTTDSTSFSVQDANDSAGSIGTPATAITSTLPAAATGNQTVAVAVQLQSGRPWLRLRATRGAGTTDTLVVSAVVLAIPHNL